MFPNAYVLKCIAVSESVRNEEIAIFSLYHIRQAEIVFIVDFDNCHFRFLYFNLCHTFELYISSGKYTTRKHLLSRVLKKNISLAVRSMQKTS